MVYKNCIVYGPYLNKKDNRLRCVLVYTNGKKQTISYPKYLIETHLGKFLDIDDTIHHIDGNPLNNDISNLKVIKRQEHCHDDAFKNKDVKVKCAYCGKEFTIKGNKVRYHNRKNHNFSGYFCSKKCSGKYGMYIKCGLKKPITVDKVIPEKYKGKSAQEEILDVEVG